MKAYKIVRIIRGRYYSYIPNEKFEIEYFIGKFVKPKFSCMPLFVCPDINSVMYIIGRINPHIKVFECEIEKHEGVLHQWCEWAQDSDGVILADSVKLLKEVSL